MEDTVLRSMVGYTSLNIYVVADTQSFVKINRTAVFTPVVRSQFVVP